MSDRLLTWFEKRKKSKTLVLAQREMIKAIDTVSELERALNAFYSGSKEETERHIAEIFKIEIEIDELRQTVFDELTKGELEPKYREDLKGLISRLDNMADHIKDAARSIKILIQVGATVPKPILELNLQIAKNFVECARHLNLSLEMLGVDKVKALQYTEKVDTCEGIIDEQYFDLKILLFKEAPQLNAPLLIELKDLANAMERASDVCDDTAGYVRTLAVSEA